MLQNFTWGDVLLKNRMLRILLWYNTFYKLTHCLKVLFGGGCYYLMPSSCHSLFENHCCLLPHIALRLKDADIPLVISLCWMKKADHGFFPYCFSRLAFKMLKSFLIYYVHSPYTTRMPPKCLPGPVLVWKDTDIVPALLEQKRE